jgi:hypothetical protein
MKRLLNLQRYSRTAQCLHVVGGFHCNHRSVMELTVLDFDAVAGYFPEHMVHQKVDPFLRQRSRFGISEHRRVQCLLPVTTSTAGSEATFWVPFLIDTGSPATFISKKTIDALKMDLADDHIAVEGKRMLWREATGGIKDPNVLGTDFLRHGDLSICYRTGEVRFSHVPTMPVTVFGLGTSLTVTPATLTAQGLKFAIKAALPETVTCNAPLMRINTPDGRVLDPCDPVHADVKYSFALPPTKNAWDHAHTFGGF